MRAMELSRAAPVETRPLRAVDCEVPVPMPDEVRVRVEVCGVCRTDLHVVEGDLEVRRSAVIPGHQVIGRVDARGDAAGRFRLGERVGIAWLRRACGNCRFCARGDENLCLTPQFTGWDADGGYAEFAVVPEDFAYPLPEALVPHEAAPLLCAGIIGYRAWKSAAVPSGGRIGLWGFGGSAHITIQVARHFGCEVYVFSRGDEHRELAEELGAAWVGASFDTPPYPLDGAILFAPAGELVPPALAALDRGAGLAIAGIHLSDVPPLGYEAHLFHERSLRSVTANTREDGRELLALASEIPLRPHTTTYPLEAANEALVELKNDRVRGAAVLEVSP
ncbi:MAG: zinc-dependent alcohol dehydrogenase family protein [Myxococcota bacterium]|jgi:propanol-preferring alcohol dehydrogenase|nr:alcohol dehydrogenase [Deltaproteobacteria bacterium]MCP4239396.1 zinc-dependent alcohol dehydrogenase family protein [bacterium]MDP6075657.1 zinc-dependent alcohol dehydrogenase family protein [Myxococcota bacterium]MDP6243047.1 zinc-dependent alcohol dehydrogenase family protein [Myxococcota bacterium]MDP7075401.1 zinc-dependent alcohol dehydrogenase family protein [Myxococcota bacterium]